jgi:hypothetical protein
MTAKKVFTPTAGPYFSTFSCQIPLAPIPHDKPSAADQNKKGAKTAFSGVDYAIINLYLWPGTNRTGLERKDIVPCYSISGS